MCCFLFFHYYVQKYGRPKFFLAPQVLQLMNDSNQSVREAAISCIEVSLFHGS
jgi:hypothetical protein